MATDLATRTSASKAEAYLQRKFAELCARIKRVDVLTHLLGLALAILTYALACACFDWFAGVSIAAALQATRWGAYGIFLGVCAFFAVQTIRCCRRRVSPYYVADQLEQSVPGAKNTLINWLDLHDDGLPTAFQRNLSARAAEQLEASDAERMVPRRKNWILLGLLGVPALGLLLVLILGPSAFFASMQRAFLPFYAPALAPRTQLTLLQPEGGDAEVGPAQAVTFRVTIAGRVPTGAQKPALHYRWNADDDFLTQPLQADGAGIWSAQLLPNQLRAGVTYTISAGDASTPEYQVRTRARAHVTKLEIAYTHRPFRNLTATTRVFPDATGSRPIIHGPVGSEVELTVRASRPVKSAHVEIATRAGKKDLPVRMLPGDPQAFACRFTLEQPGQFRIAFSTPDGEDNADRDLYPILVIDDDTPKVVLTHPGEDVSLPENGTLQLAGNAVSAVGVKSMTLHLRVVKGAKESLLPLAFRDGTSLQHADGSYPVEVPYQAVLELDRLKAGKGIPHAFPSGTEIEYWLEATDCADYPNPAGNVGRSQPYKITFLPRPMDPTREEIKRKQALDKQKNFDKQQDEKKSQPKQDPKSGTGSGSQNSQQTLNQIQKEQNAANKKLNDAQQDQKKNQQRGGAKGADPQNGEKKDGPQKPGDTPQQKPEPSSPKSDAGDKKDQGKAQGGGEARDQGDAPKKKDDSSKGDKKEGSKQASTPGKDGGMGKQDPAGGTRDGGSMGKNGPEPTPTKDNAMGDGAPMPSAKSKTDARDYSGPPPANVKGIEQNGPELPNKDQQTAANPMQPPHGNAKPGTMPGDNRDAKQEPTDATKSGQARGDDAKPAPREPDWDDIARHIEKLPRDDKVGDQAGKALKEIEKTAADQRMREIAKEALAKNGRDTKTGAKAPNPYGTLGKSEGIGDDIKTAAANRAFAARIGQMQLDDWKKRLTPDLLRKAGLSEADWQRYVKNQDAYDALVRRLNAQAAQDAIKHLVTKKGQGTTLRAVEGPGGNEALRGSTAPPPLELLDAFKRQVEREKK